jgi:hypothetical protein
LSIGSGGGRPRVQLNEPAIAVSSKSLREPTGETMALSARRWLSRALTFWHVPVGVMDGP